MPEQMGDVAADRTDVRAFQIQFCEIVQLIKAQRSVDGEFVGVNLLKLRLVAVEFVLNIADQLLHYVFEGGHSDRSAEFIDHDSEVGVLAEKESQQLFKRHHFGNRDELALDL